MTPTIMDERLKKVVALKFVWNGGFNSFMNDDLEIKMTEIQKLSDESFDGLIKLMSGELEGRARPDNMAYQALLTKKREAVREIRRKEGNREYFKFEEYPQALRAANKEFQKACEAGGFQNRIEYRESLIEYVKL